METIHVYLSIEGAKWRVFFQEHFSEKGSKVESIYPGVFISIWNEVESIYSLLLVNTLG